MNKRTRNYLINHYTRVLAIQNIYQEYHTMGVTNEKIWEKYVFPTYRIGRSTFYEYLTIPAKAKLRELENENQPN